ncbi:MAG: hypothetical protein Q4C58_13140 [Eubacteriales bacterium]|nr:hypothetical protein [Eubacteriales bacterium]
MWKKIKETDRNHRFEIAYILIALFAVSLPYLRQDLVVGSDAPFHLARIESLKEGLRGGMFPVKVHSVLCYQYGYGVGLFYPNFFLYIPAFFRIMGLSLEVSYKLFAGLLFLGMFASMYYSVYRGIGDRMLALAAGALYLFSTPVLDGVYHGFTLAQNQALVFMPLAIMGMLIFAARDKKPWMLAAGFTGLIYSHVLSTVMAVAVCFIILVCYIFRWKNFKKKCMELAGAILGVCGITFAYWGPMLEQFAAQTYRVSQPWTHVSDNVAGMYNMLTEEGFGVVLTVAWLVCVLYVLYEWKRIDREAKICMVLGTGLMLLLTCQPFWNVTEKLFDSLQFTSRLTRPAVILVIFAIMWCLKYYGVSSRLKPVLTMFTLGICVYAGLCQVSGDRKNLEDFGDRVLYEEIAGLGAGEEWLPVETTREVMVTPLTAFSETGDAFAGSREGNNFYFVVSGESDVYRMPLVWYKGYKAETENGIQLSVEKNGDDGLVLVSGVRNAKETTKIHVWYDGTAAQRISYLTSFLTAIGVAGIAIGKKLNRKSGIASGIKLFKKG